MDKKRDYECRNELLKVYSGLNYLESFLVWEPKEKFWIEKWQEMKITGWKWR